MRRVFKVSILPYPGDCYVILGSRKFALQKLGSIFQDTDSDELLEPGWSAAALEDKKKLVYAIWLQPPFQKDGTMAHEVSHAVERILTNIGIKRALASEEAFTYMTEYITKQIHDKLRKVKQ
jgi:hypothetical protein